jgi:outer membrane protein OmpA-like peptidoglycan-associated protein
VLQNDRGTGVEVIKRNNQIILEMPSDVTFSFNKFNIQPRFYGVLNTVRCTLAKYPATYVDVNGHTDPSVRLPITSACRNAAPMRCRLSG